MVKTKTRTWDAAEHLDTAEDMAAYLEAALDEGDPALIAAVLGDIARAKGMTEIAREAGLGRESLYKALSTEGNPEFATVLSTERNPEFATVLSTEGNPEFATVLKIVRALGLKLHATAE